MILTTRDTRPCAPNHLYYFQRWLRRPMSPLEQSVIEPIERLRSDNRRLDRPTRVYVDDPGTHGSAIRDILILYMRWSSTLISPFITPQQKRKRPQSRMRQNGSDARRPALRLMGAYTRM